MRAKQSSTADATYSGFAPPCHLGPDFFIEDVAVFDRGVSSRDTGSQHPETGGLAEADPRTSSRNFQGRDLQNREVKQRSLQRAARSRQAAPSDVRGEGLLHDARNLVSAIGLYCDLLSMPGVLKPEHRKYPEELRLLGTRSRVLIEHLMHSLASQNSSNQDLPRPRSNQDSGRSGTTGTADLADSRMHGALPDVRAAEPDMRDKPVSLRATVERCRGLLSRVANDCPIEVIYGAAADVPVWVGEEAIERILVNLVRNASQALDREPHPSPVESERHSLDSGPHASHPSHGRHPGGVSPVSAPSPIRISVGPLLDRVGRARSWPFLHVRLVVEDSGCGMEQKQLHALLSNRMAESDGSHGIGFRVVRELVATSKGDLCVVSTPGVGTRVQIEWPVAATSTPEKDRSLMQRKGEPDSTLKTTAMKMQHRSISAASREPATLEGRQGAY